ncbi:MAG: hypothetical protein ACE360_00555 [Hyphomicrobiales bacterium]
MTNNFDHDNRTIIDRYSKKKKFDWDTLWGTIFLIVIAVVALNIFAG